MAGSGSARGLDPSKYRRFTALRQLAYAIQQELSVFGFTKCHGLRIRKGRQAVEPQRNHAPEQFDLFDAYRLQAIQLKPFHFPKSRRTFVRDEFQTIKF